MNNLCRILIAFCLLVSIPAAGQHIRWEVNARGNVEGIGIETDRSGNIYGIAVTGGLGSFSGAEVTFGTTTFGDFWKNAIIVAKYDANGKYLWAVTTRKSNAICIGNAMDENDNLYILGWYTDSAITMGSTTTVNPNPQGELFVAKINSSGNVLWINNVGNIGQFMGYTFLPGGIAEKNGSLYISSLFISPVVNVGTHTVFNTDPTGQTNDILVAKLDTGGNAIWAKSCGGSGAEMGSIICAAGNGDIYLSGCLDSTSFHIDTYTLPPGMQSSYFLARLDSSGKPLWVTGGGNIMVAPSSITCDNGANVILTGIFMDSVLTIGSYTLTNHTPNFNSFLSKFDSSGSVLWAKSVLNNNPYVNIVITDRCDNIWMNGGLGGRLAIDGDTTWNYGVFYDDLFLMELDPAGKPLQKFFFQTGGEDICAMKMAANGDILMCGDTSCKVMDEELFVRRFTPNQPDTLPATSYLCLREGTSIASPPTGYTYYQWNDGSSNSSRILSTPGTYWVRCSNGCGMPCIIDTFKVGASSVMPDFTFGPDIFSCTPVVLKVPKHADAYSWQDSSTADTFYVSHTGTYYTTIRIQGCYYSDTIVVNARDIAQQLPDTVLCGDIPVALPYQANLPTGSAALWSTGDTTPAITITGAGTYWLLVSDTTCSAGDTFSVATKFCECNTVLPGAFSPNNDGKNDLYHPIVEQGCIISNYRFSIFDRWGKRIFLAENPAAKWDGRFNGTPQDAGTYMYLVEYDSGNSQTKHLLKGHFLLVR